MPSKAILVGRLSSTGASKKCRSMAAAPAKSDSKCAYPTESEIERPTALQSENLPPTQSAMGNTMSSFIPKLAVCPKLVDTAAK